jgi:RNA polymerase sigma-70 factor, ECF subfamily
VKPHGGHVLGDVAVGDAAIPNDEARQSELVRLLTSHQRDIYLYVRSLVLDANEVEEIVQETNLVLWEKRDQFDTSKDFRPWAFQFARYKLSEHRARQRRNGVCFSDTLVDELALQASQCAPIDNELKDELRLCVAQLAARDRELLNQRYSLLASCESIAAEFGRPVRWVYNTLNRVRQELFDCLTRHARPGEDR